MLYYSLVLEFHEYTIEYHYFDNIGNYNYIFNKKKKNRRKVIVITTTSSMKKRKNIEK